MRSEDFEFLYRLEESFWWFVAMRRITDAIVETQSSHRLKDVSKLRVLDAGCGTGFNLGYYSATAGHEIYGFDVADQAIRSVHRRGFLNVCQASVSEIPFPSGMFDLVLSLDVISHTSIHLQDAGIREMYRVLRPGGSLFIRVPAFQWLWSSHDEDQGASRRFSIPELSEQLRRAGFRVTWSTYANCFLFPVVVLRRMVKTLGIGRGAEVKPLPAALAWLDPVFRRILEKEAAVFQAGRTLPFGSSAICFAEKSR
jgi:SAM-dependent methyltransferase